MHSDTPIILKGYLVQLENLRENHRKELFQAAQDHTIWRYTLSSAFGEEFNLWFDAAIDSELKAEQLPFVVRRINDRKILGSTRYYQINRKHRHLSIGYTWYIPEVWGSYVNPECKYLLLNYAFETMGMNRVEFCTDKNNKRSRAALKKLGATEEGILRHHMVLRNGSIRDSVIFSIIAEEWPDVKETLEERIASLEIV